MLVALTRHLNQIQRAALRRQIYGTLAALTSHVIIWFAYFNTTDASQFDALICIEIVFWSGWLALLLSTWSGHSARFLDVGLTLPTIIWVILKYSIMLYFVFEFRLLVLLSFLSILSFGAFRLSWRDYIFVSLFTMFCYAISLYALHRMQNVPMHLSLEIIYGLTLYLCLIVYSFVGNEYYQLRVNYRKKNNELRRAMRRISELAVRDELTGLFNRRYLLQELDKYKSAASRGDRHFAIAYLDIDHFKHINDDYGHHIGDQVLRELADFLQTSIRDNDMVARYGGEEFVVILDELNITDAELVLERIRLAIEQRQFSELSISVTVSMGAVQYQLGESDEVLFGRADALLYQAKSEGRNCIRLDNGNSQQTDE